MCKLIYTFALSFSLAGCFGANSNSTTSKLSEIKSKLSAQYEFVSLGTAKTAIEKWCNVSTSLYKLEQKETLTSKEQKQKSEYEAEQLKLEKLFIKTKDSLFTGITNQYTITKPGDTITVNGNVIKLEAYGCKVVQWNDDKNPDPTKNPSINKDLFTYHYFSSDSFVAVKKGPDEKFDSTIFVLDCSNLKAADVTTFKDSCSKSQADDVYIHTNNNKNVACCKGFPHHKYYEENDKLTVSVLSNSEIENLD